MVWNVKAPAGTCVDGPVQIASKGLKKYGLESGSAARQKEASVVAPWFDLFYFSWFAETKF